jgi:hypothetical protein
MALTDSFLVVPFLDQDGLLEQICSAVKRLLQKPTRLRYPYSTETYNSLDGLYREVMKLDKTGLVPELGPRLLASYQELDCSANCSALLEEECSIEDDKRSIDFLMAMTYLKLSAFCASHDARYLWADLAKKVKHDRIPSKALEDLDLIGLHNEVCDVVAITCCGEFVVHGMRLICEVFCEEPQYKLYMALKEAHIPWGYDGKRNTTEMVQFLIEQLEGTN